MTKGGKNVLQVVVPCNHIPPCLHETAWWPRGSRAISVQRGHREPPEVSRPNHHPCHSAESKCRSRPVEGMAEIQEGAWGEETERIWALFTWEEEESRDWKAWLSCFLDRTLCIEGDKLELPQVSKHVIAWSKWMLSGLQHRDKAKEAMKAAGECRARARNPSPPKLGLSCACCQLESGTSAWMQEVKHSLASSSKSFR